MKTLNELLQKLQRAAMQGTRCEEIKDEIKSLFQQSGDEQIMTLALHLYSRGYQSGHHDTVEGGFCDDPSGKDADYYHKESVCEILREYEPPCEDCGSIYPVGYKARHVCPN